MKTRTKEQNSFRTQPTRCAEMIPDFESVSLVEFKLSVVELKVSLVELQVSLVEHEVS